MIPAAAAGQQFSYTGWAQYSTGRYQFPARTSSLYFSNGLTGNMGRFRASASIPYIVQDAGWTQYGGSGIVPTGGMPGHDSTATMMQRGMMAGRGMVATHMGFGDPLGRAELLLRRASDGAASVALTAAVKPPLVSASSGFGTGQWDYAGGAAITSVIASLVLTADASYWILGDVPALRFRNPFAYALSVGRVVHNRRVGFLGAVSGTTPILSGVPGSAIAGAGFTYRLSEHSVLTSNASLGLTRSSPSVVVALGWRRQLD